MNRWPEDKYILDVGDGETYDMAPVGKWVAENIAKAYNAACDAYEARIAELEAERDALAARINPDGAPVDVTALCVEIDEATTRIAELEGKAIGRVGEWMRAEIAWKSERDSLRADLARTRAESLRVVPVGEPVLFDHIQRDQFVLMDGEVFVPDKLRCQMVRITDNLRVDVQQQFMDDVKFQVARIERWKAEE